MVVLFFNPVIGNCFLKSRKPFWILFKVSTFDIVFTKSGQWNKLNVLVFCLNNNAHCINNKIAQLEAIVFVEIGQRKCEEIQETLSWFRKMKSNKAFEKYKESRKELKQRIRRYIKYYWQVRLKRFLDILK